MHAWEPVRQVHPRAAERQGGESASQQERRHRYQLRREGRLHTTTAPDLDVTTGARANLRVERFRGHPIFSTTWEHCARGGPR